MHAKPLAQNRREATITRSRKGDFLRRHRWLLLILAAGLILRLGAVAAFPHVPESDELAYRGIALNIVAGNGVVDGMGNRAMYNVGYPLFVLAPIFALFGENLLVVRLVNVLLGMLTVLLCYAVAREAGLGRIGRHATAALWAIYLPASVYAVYMGKENLLAPLMLGVAWCALRMLRDPSWATAALCGTLLGGTALVGNAGLALAGSVVLALAFAPGPLVRKGALAMLITAASLLVVSPWVIRNLRVLGSPVLNTNGGFNFYLGNNPAATGWFISISETPRGESWEALRRTGEVAASRTLQREALQWIREHPLQFAALTAKKAVYFWTPPPHQGKGPPSSAERAVRLASLTQFVAIGAVGLGSLAGLGFRLRPMLVVWTGIVAYTGIFALCYASFRYQLVIEPLMCLLAGGALERLWAQRTSRSVSREPEGSSREARGAA